MTIETLVQAESQDIHLFTLAQAQRLQLQLHSFKFVMHDGDKTLLRSSHLDLPIWAYPYHTWNTRNLFVRCVTGLFELMFNSSIASSDTRNGNTSSSSSSSSTGLVDEIDSNNDEFISIRESVTYLALTERIEPAISWFRQAKQSLSNSDNY
jgi:hypothetical protein